MMDYMRSACRFPVNLIVVWSIGVIDLDKQAQRNVYPARVSFSDRIRPREMKTRVMPV